MKLATGYRLPGFAKFAILFSALLFASFFLRPVAQAVVPDDWPKGDAKLHQLLVKNVVAGMGGAVGYLAMLAVTRLLSRRGA